MYEKCFSVEDIETELKNTMQFYPTEMITETSSLELEW